MGKRTISRDDVGAYLELARSGRTDDAVRLCLDLLDGGTPAPVITTRLLRTAQHEVGRLWALGTWAVAQEHAATAVADTCLAVLATAAPATPRGIPILVASPPGEWHCLAGRMVTELLRWRGAAAHYAGPLPTPKALDEVLASLRPRALALSCSTTAALPGVAAVAAVAADRDVPVLGGGAGFGHQGRYGPAVGVAAWAHSHTEAIRRLSLWAHQPPRLGGPPPEPLAYRRLLRTSDALADEITTMLLAGPAEPHIVDLAGDTARQAVALALAAARTEDLSILHDGLGLVASSLARRTGGPPDLAARLRPAVRQALERHGHSRLRRGCEPAPGRTPPNGRSGSAATTAGRTRAGTGKA